MLGLHTFPRICSQFLAVIINKYIFTTSHIVLIIYYDWLHMWTVEHLKCFEQFTENNNARLKSFIIIHKYRHVFFNLIKPMPVFHWKTSFVFLIHGCLIYSWRHSKLLLQISHFVKSVHAPHPSSSHCYRTPIIFVFFRGFICFSQIHRKPKSKRTGRMDAIALRRAMRTAIWNKQAVWTSNSENKKTVAKRDRITNIAGQSNELKYLMVYLVCGHQSSSSSKKDAIQFGI